MSTTVRAEKENPMGSRAVFPLLIAMSIPPMISMLTSSLYNIADGIYVSAIGEEAFTAVSLVYPLQNLVLSVAVGVGVGMNSYIARAIGAGKDEEAGRTAGNAMLAILLHYVGFVLVGLFLAEPYLRMFTEDEEILAMGVEYAQIVLCVSFANLAYLIYEKIFQAEGMMYAPMFCQIAGAVVNIILDPVMIFGWWGCPAMGVAGAAWATVIGQIASLALIMLVYWKKKGRVQIRKGDMRFDGRILKAIYQVAIPSTLVMCMPSVLVSILNGILAQASEVGVAAFGLYYKLQTFVYMPANGLVQGLRPLVAYNYGARKDRRLYGAVRAGMVIAAAIMLAGAVLCQAVPGLLLSWFHAEGALLEAGTTCLRVISLGFLPSAVGVILAGAFEGLGLGQYSLAISLMRQIVVIPVLSLLLAGSLGMMGVWVSFPIAEAAAAAAGWALYRSFKKKFSSSIAK